MKASEARKILKERFEKYGDLSPKAKRQADELMNGGRIILLGSKSKSLGKQVKRTESEKGFWHTQTGLKTRWALLLPWSACFLFFSSYLTLIFAELGLKNIWFMGAQFLPLVCNYLTGRLIMSVSPDKKIVPVIVSVFLFGIVSLVTFSFIAESNDTYSVPILWVGTLALIYGLWSNRKPWPIDRPFSYE